MEGPHTRSDRPSRLHLLDDPLGLVDGVSIKICAQLNTTPRCVQESGKCSDHQANWLAPRGVEDLCSCCWLDPGRLGLFDPGLLCGGGRTFGRVFGPVFGRRFGLRSFGPSFSAGSSDACIGLLVGFALVSFVREKRERSCLIMTRPFQNPAEARGRNGSKKSGMRVANMQRVLHFDPQQHVCARLSQTNWHA